MTDALAMRHAPLAPILFSLLAFAGGWAIGGHWVIGLVAALVEPACRLVLRGTDGRGRRRRHHWPTRTDLLRALLRGPDQQRSCTTAVIRTPCAA